MEFEKVIPVIFILGIISLFFLITGIKGLIQRRMKILNPLADRTPFSMTDIVFNVLKKKVETDYPVPDNFAGKDNMIDITGKDLLFRAWIHIALGILSIFVMIIFLLPSIFEWILDLFHKIKTITSRVQVSHSAPLHAPLASSVRS